MMLHRNGTAILLAAILVGSAALCTACATEPSAPEDVPAFAKRFTDRAVKAMESAADVEQVSSFYAEDVINEDVRSGTSTTGRDEVLDAFRWYATNSTSATIDYVVTGDGWFAHRVVATTGTAPRLQERWVIISEVEQGKITRQAAIPVED